MHSLDTLSDRTRDSEEEPATVPSEVKLLKLNFYLFMFLNIEEAIKMNAQNTHDT